MPQEVLAVASDVARYAFPDLAGISQAVRELLEDLRAGRMLLPEHLREPVERFRGIRIRDGESWPSHEMVRAVIERVRDACGPKMLPCLVKW